MGHFKHHLLREHISTGFARPERVAWSRTRRMPPPMHVSFVGGEHGTWRVDSVSEVVGESLPVSKCVDIIEGPEPRLPRRSAWTLKGTVSNIRYATREELKQLAAKQEGLGRPEATCAALIPIKKNEAWWALSQDERSDIMLKGKHT